MRSYLAAGLAAALGSAAMMPKEARACGCLAPSVATPVVQVGERIVFARDEGKIVAHIQIQYQGPAQDFAWLLPTPSEPTLKLGTEELFAQLDLATKPGFQLFRSSNCGSGGLGCSDSAPLAGSVLDEQPDVLVTRAALGPYDYAVLRADAKEPMLEWLAANNYFVPAGTDDTLRPYIRPGAFFLAVKLRSGETTGDLQPVVVEYAAELPMIPIILTSVAAADDMGILVYVLGDARAIPRNYAHVVLNQEHIHWLKDSENYADVVKKAIDEAENHHAFITEYAGDSLPVRGRLDYPGRFGDYETIIRQNNAGVYFQSLGDSTFPWALAAPVLKRYFPYPAAARGVVTEQEYYESPATHVPRFDPERTFDAAALTEELWTRIVRPAKEAEELILENSYLTRMLTILSPAEMTEDPVFGFNADLPRVDNIHRANLNNVSCGNGSEDVVLSLPDGRDFELDHVRDWDSQVTNDTPFARRIEILREEGQPQVLVSNSGEITAGAGESGCSSTGRPLQGLSSALLLLAVCAIGRCWMKRGR